MSIECSVVSKSRVLYSGEVYSIVLPGIEGDIGILENHEPFMTYLKDGVIWGRVDGADGAILSAANMGGYVQVIGRRVLVLCDKTRYLNEIDLDLLHHDIPLIEARLKTAKENDFVAQSYLSRKLHWCNVQLAGKLKEDKYR